MSKKLTKEKRLELEYWTSNPTKKYTAEEWENMAPEEKKNLLTPRKI